VNSRHGTRAAAWVLVAASWCGATGHAADWPQWGGGQQRNLVSRETGIPAAFHPGKKKRDRLGFDPTTAKNVRWMVRLGSENYSGPVVARGRVFIGTNDEDLDDPRFRPTRGGVLMCLDEKTGDLVWRLVVPRLEIDRSLVSEDFDDMNLGICSTATVDGGFVYLVTNRCEVVCLDVDGMADGNDGPFREEAAFSVPAGATPVMPGPRDADILWRFDMIRDLPVFPHDAANCSVLVVGPHLYVCTANGVYDGKVVLPTAASLIVLDKQTGKLLARDDGTISADVFHGQWSSPTILDSPRGQRVIFGGGDGRCHGFVPLARDARPRSPTPILDRDWVIDCNPPGYRARGDIAIDYWALVRGKATSIDDTGLVVSPNEIIGSPVVVGNRVYVAIGQDPVHGPGRGALSCITVDGAEDGAEARCLWRYTGIGRALSTVAVGDGLVYAAEYAGKLHCLDADSGELVWFHDTRDEIWSSPFVVDGKVYIGGRTSFTVLSTGRQKRTLAQIKLGSPVWSIPCAANKTLFVASQRNLWAVEEQGEMRP